MTDLNDHGFVMMIDDMEIEADKSLLFDREYVIWGELVL